MSPAPRALVVSRLRRALRAFVRAHEAMSRASYAEPGPHGWQWNDAIWQAADPAGFRLVQRAKAALRGR